MSKQGYVFGPTEGEHLIRNAGSILIKVDPSRGSNNMALGTQQVPIRTGIQIHQHQTPAAEPLKETRRNLSPNLTVGSSGG